MICNNCYNKQICKYYDTFKNIPIDITINVSSCELFKSKENIPQYIVDKKVSYRQPLEYENVDIEDSDEYTDEEPVIVDLNYMQEQDLKEPVSMFEYLTKESE